MSKYPIKSTRNQKLQLSKLTVSEVKDSSLNTQYKLGSCHMNNELHVKTSNSKHGPVFRLTTDVNSSSIMKNEWDPVSVECLVLVLCTRSAS